MEFKVTFQLESQYENEENNILKTEIQYIEAESLELLLEELDGDYIESYDDISVINIDTDDYLIGTNIDYVLIEDENENVMYKDEEIN
jgi:hypothetical protein|tara:strand:- start:1507 stop:1770 length:264 start_codon:yes stop_codon:yes gene_type:complete